MATEEWREVKIAQGTLRGRKHPETDVFVFYGVPYATTPVGVNKFKVYFLLNSLKPVEFLL